MIISHDTYFSCVFFFFFWFSSSFSFSHLLFDFLLSQQNGPSLEFLSRSFTVTNILCFYSFRRISVSFFIGTIENHKTNVDIRRMKDKERTTPPSMNRKKLKRFFSVTFFHVSDVDFYHLLLIFVFFGCAELTNKFTSREKKRFNE